MFIPDPNFSIPDLGYEFFHPGSSVNEITDPDPHQRIEVFLALKTFSKLSGKNNGGCSSRIRIFSIPDPDPDPGVKKAPWSGTATLYFSLAFIGGTAVSAGGGAG
jgi:hypothetical protein